MSDDGNILAIGVPYKDDSGFNTGQVKVYKNVNDNWIQLGNAINGEILGGKLGTNVSLSSDGSIIAVGAPSFYQEEGGWGQVKVYKNVNDNWIQIGTDIISEINGDELGYSVSLSDDGNILAIGVPRNRDNGFNRGQVKIYKNVNDNWIQIGNGIDGEGFGDLSGSSVSLSSDGNIVAIGAPRNRDNGGLSGQIRVFKNINNNWIQIGDDIDGEASINLLGISVSLSSDGSIVAVGAPGNENYLGHVRIFENINDSWLQIGNDIDGYGKYGYSLSLSSDGNVIVIGAEEGLGYAGYVRILKRENNNWVQIGETIEGENSISRILFGSSVGLSSDGTTVAAGAQLLDNVEIFKRDNDNWIKKGNISFAETGYTNLCSSLSLSSDGNIIAIGAPEYHVDDSFSGQVKMYKYVSNDWVQIGNLLSGENNYHFGYNVSLSSDGTTVAISTLYNRLKVFSSVIIYKNINDIWTQIGSIIEEGFGDVIEQSINNVELSSDGSIVAVGCLVNDDNGENSGRVRVFKNLNNVWTQLGNTIEGEEAYDLFGKSVSLSDDGNILAIGAHGSDLGGTGSGQAKIYRNVNNNWTQIGNTIIGKKGEKLGYEVSLSSNGDVVIVRLPNVFFNGIYLDNIKAYKNVNDNWIQIGSTIKSEELQFFGIGNRISLSSDGNTLAFGLPFNNKNGYNSGGVRVYDLSAVLSTKSFKKDYFSFYPNPLKDILNIDLYKGFELSQVNIYNIQS